MLPAPYILAEFAIGNLCSTKRRRKFCRPMLTWICAMSFGVFGAVQPFSDTAYTKAVCPRRLHAWLFAHIVCQTCRCIPPMPAAHSSTRVSLPAMGRRLRTCVKRAVLAMSMRFTYGPISPSSVNASRTRA